jgi:uncharacterized DUF497 family protein
MPFFFFVWDEENERHLAAHGVSREEFEEVVCGPGLVTNSRSTARPIAFGTTSAGRYLACVYELIEPDTVYPITAYEPEERD